MSASRKKTGSSIGRKVAQNKTIEKKKVSRKKASSKKATSPIKKKPAKKATAKKATSPAKKATAKKATSPGKKTTEQVPELAKTKKAKKKTGRKKRGGLSRPTKPVVRPGLPGGEELIVHKPSLGEKWECFSCGAKFYDLNKEDVICPKCEADQSDRPKTTRGGSQRAQEKPRLPVVPPRAAATEEDDEDSEEYDTEESELELTPLVQTERTGFLAEEPSSVNEPIPED